MFLLRGFGFFGGGAGAHDKPTRKKFHEHNDTSVTIQNEREAHRTAGLEGKLANAHCKENYLNQKKQTNKKKTHTIDEKEDDDDDAGRSNKYQKTPVTMSITQERERVGKMIYEINEIIDYLVF